ncbi:hypothetical protein HYH02_015180, partial [Chlamydomonas schloesseri]
MQRAAPSAAKAAAPAAPADAADAAEASALLLVLRVLGHGPIGEAMMGLGARGWAGARRSCRALHACVDDAGREAELTVDLAEALGVWPAGRLSRCSALTVRVMTGGGQEEGGQGMPLITTAPARQPGETEEELAHRQKEQRDMEAQIIDECKALLPDPQQLAPWLDTVAALGDKKAAVLASLVNPRLRMGNTGFDGMMVTDGVATSLQYTRTVPGVRARLHKTQRAKKVREACEEPPSECKHGDTTIADVINTAILQGLGMEEGCSMQTVAVLGWDPGRCVIATVVLVDLQGKTHTWRLTRGEFHNRSGIRTYTRKRVSRMGPDLIKKLCDLGSKTNIAAAGENTEEQEQDSGAEASDYSDLTTPAEAKLHSTALRASTSGEILQYAIQTADILPDWWRSALRRTERRCRLGVFSGKRCILDGFVAKVLREASAVLARDQQLEARKPLLQVAYGEAGMSMPASGRGELAVPTSGMFKALKRVCRATSIAAQKLPQVPRC